ncbi:MAG: tetratricopeptide repeat protein [bacterium]|nr:tetratricopeptide repeat protein [bacterium]
MKENFFKILVTAVILCILLILVAGWFYTCFIYGRNIDRMKGELEQVISSLEEKQKELQSEREMRALTEGKHSQLGETAREHKDTIDKLKQKNAELEQLTNELTRTKTEMEQMLTSKEMDFNSLRDARKIEMEKYEKTVTEEKNRNKSLEEQKNILSEKISDMRSEIDRLRVNGDEARLELERARERVAELEEVKKTAYVKETAGKESKEETLVSGAKSVKKEAEKTDVRKRTSKSKKTEEISIERPAEQTGLQEEPAIYYNAALECQQTGRYKEALDNYKKALALDPSDPDIHYNLAILYDENIEDNKKAVYHYKRYLELNPGAEDRGVVVHWIDEAEREENWGNNLHKFDFFRK